MQQGRQAARNILRMIRGETPHFEYISAEASRGIARAGCEANLPVIFGVLTTDTAEQALERAGAPERNKGAEAARTAIEMANLMKQLRGVADKPTRARKAPKSARRRR